MAYFKYKICRAVASAVVAKLKYIYTFLLSYTVPAI